MCLYSHPHWFFFFFCCYHYYYYCCCFILSHPHFYSIRHCSRGHWHTTYPTGLTVRQEACRAMRSSHNILHGYVGFSVEGFGWFLSLIQKCCCFMCRFDTNSLHFSSFATHFSFCRRFVCDAFTESTMFISTCPSSNSRSNDGFLYSTGTSIELNSKREGFLTVFLICLSQTQKNIFIDQALH